MRVIAIILVSLVSVLAAAQEGELAPISSTTTEEISAEIPAEKFSEVRSVAPMKRPSAQEINVERRPAATTPVPQKYFDSEHNVVCYYISVPVYEGVAQTAAPAISCVKLPDKKRNPTTTEE